MALSRFPVLLLEIQFLMLRRARIVAAYPLAPWEEGQVRVADQGEGQHTVQV